MSGKAACRNNLEENLGVDHAVGHFRPHETHAAAVQTVQNPWEPEKAPSLGPARLGPLIEPAPGMLIS